VHIATELFKYFKLISQKSGFTPAKDTCGFYKPGLVADYSILKNSCFNSFMPIRCAKQHIISNEWAIRALY